MEILLLNIFVQVWGSSCMIISGTAAQTLPSIFGESRLHEFKHLLGPELVMRPGMG